MRKIPDITPPATITPRKLEIVEQRRTYELITPLYGGGVEASKADPITIVRATEIRGLLRFWWRVMRGGQSENDLSMQERENAIWGKAYEKGEKGIEPEKVIQILVDILKQGTPIKPFEVRGSRPAAINDIPGYVAFPLQPPQDARRDGNRPPISDVRQGVQFTLTITYPESLRDEIEAALWAWETFGGLGARTRRGFGALHLIAIEGTSQPLLAPRDVERWIREQAKKHCKGGNFPPSVPHLSSTLQLVVTQPSPNPMLAWNRLIRKLQNFRQQKNARRRSAWPEADTIRAITGKGSTPRVQKFPRAAFGLPIIFHFTGNNAPEGNYALNEEATEPRDHPDDPPNRERFASPLVLRPFLCSDKQAVGLALLLEGSRVNLKNLVLQDDSEDKNVQEVNNTSTLSGVLTPGEARIIAQRSADAHEGTDALRALQNETDVLQAFLKSVKGV